MDPELKPEQPEPEITPADTAHAPEPQEPAAPAKSGWTEQIPRFARLGLLGVGVLIAVFLAGFLTDHFARYTPLKATLTQTQKEYSDLQAQKAKLDEQLATADSLSAKLEKDNKTLQSDLDSANLHIELLQALADINAAHIALNNNDVSGAKVALANTASRLEDLKPLVATVDAALAENMLKRLDLIKTGMDSNPETAKADLGLFAKNLHDVETLLFAP